MGRRVPKEFLEELHAAASSTSTRREISARVIPWKISSAISVPASSKPKPK